MAGVYAKLVVTPAGKPAAAAHVRDDYGVSEQRASLVLKVNGSMTRFQSKRAGDAGAGLYSCWGGVGFEATPSGSEGEVQLFAQVR